MAKVIFETCQEFPSCFETVKSITQTKTYTFAHVCVLRERDLTKKVLASG